MTLTTHAIVGASTATIFSFHPVAAIAAAFLSHFAIDAIRHWDYFPRSFLKDHKDPLKSDMIIGEHFGRDFIIIASDASLGMILSLALFSPSSIYDFWTIVLGAGFGILPDPLQFVYWKLKREPLVSLQRFHKWAHNKNESWTHKNHWKIGLFCQLVLILGFLWLTKFYFLL